MTALSSSADILIFGGSAGSGKSRGLLMEPMRHLQNPKFGGVIFRRTYPNIRNEGGLWDESKEVYLGIGGRPREGNLDWVFPSGARMQFRHLSSEKELLDWHGAQVPFFGFDELTEFTEKSFWYLLSRNRSTSGVRPYVRATCNPDSESWVARLIDWWIDEEGFPMQERSGTLRWMVRVDEQIEWADSKEEAVDVAVQAGTPLKLAKLMPKSFTFVPAKLSDNPTLEKADPGYRTNLMALPYVDRMRLLEGNWRVKPATGEMFPRGKWRIRNVAPAKLNRCRGWDKAGTEGGTGARSAGVLVAYDPETMGWWILHATAGRWSDIDRENVLKAIAQRDDLLYKQVPIIIEQEPGSGGKDSALASVRRLAGHAVGITTVTGPKVTRWRSLAAQVQAGNVSVLDDGSWDVEDFLSELNLLSGDEKEDKPRLKDFADAASLAFNRLAIGMDTMLPENILASGEDPAEERRMITEDDYDDLPDVIVDILKSLK
jgi:phage terminase large subunit-like protein